MKLIVTETPVSSVFNEHFGSICTVFKVFAPLKNILIVYINIFRKMPSECTYYISICLQTFFVLVENVKKENAKQEFLPVNLCIVFVSTEESVDNIHITKKAIQYNAVVFLYSTLFSLYQYKGSSSYHFQYLNY